MSGLRNLGDKAMVCGQVAPADVAGFAGEGVTMLVNNRPDGEEPGQPAAAEIEAAAEAAGIGYRYVPIIRGIGPADVEAMQDAVRAAGDGKLLAFCRSGQRSAFALALAQRGEGASRETVEQCLNGAGIDPGPIAHLL
ncbi:MAG: TIGR01244 family sulfur transferase [Sphingomicrobium sp.]